MFSLWLDKWILVRKNGWKLAESGLNLFGCFCSCGDLRGYQPQVGPKLYTNQFSTCVVPQSGNLQTILPPLSLSQSGILQTILTTLSLSQSGNLQTILPTLSLSQSGNLQTILPPLSLSQSGILQTILPTLSLS